MLSTLRTRSSVALSRAHVAGLVGAGPLASSNNRIRDQEPILPSTSANQDPNIGPSVPGHGTTGCRITRSLARTTAAASMDLALLAPTTSNLDTVVPDCTGCDQPSQDSMLTCENCGLKSHPSCANMEPELFERVAAWYCYKCTDKSKDQVTRWHLKRADKAKRLDKAKYYWEVDKILDHKINKRTGERKFLISWTNYNSKQATWEPEHHLDGCYPLLQAYCAEHSLKFSGIQGILGASGIDEEDRKFNVTNWVEPKVILKIIFDTLAKSRMAINLAIAVFSGLHKIDSIYLFPYQSHCYVILHFAGYGYIADGTNSCFDPETLDRISDNIGLELKPVRFNQQTAIDHCGSSAVCIAIEFNRAYNRNIRPTILVASKRQLKRVKELFHQSDSEKIPGKELREFRTKLICPTCDARYKVGDTNAFKNHCNKCNGIKIKQESVY